MDVRRDYKNTMDTNPTETTEKVDVPETGTSEESQDSSSSQEADYDALIEAERKRGPDPDKAKEAFRKRQEKREHEEPEEEDEERPMTRKEVEEYLARRSHEIVADAHKERIQEIATELSQSEGESRYIMEVHKNRYFPEGMSLREQVEEAYYIANGRKMAAKNLELARKVSSKDSVSKDTSSGVQVENKSEPSVGADVKQALRNAGFTYDASLKIYTKQLPNGKKMFRDPKTNRTGLL